MSISKADIDAMSKGMAPVIRKFVAQELNRAPFNDRQMDILGEVLAGVQRDIRDATNPLRERLGMPVFKIMPYERPRVRVKAGSRPWTG